MIRSRFRRILDGMSVAARTFPASGLPKAVSLPLTVLVERQEVDHPWLDARWRPVAVEAGQSANAPWTEIGHSDRAVRYDAGTHALELHRSDADAYFENRTSRNPSVFVVLTRGQGSGLPGPYKVRLISASGYALQDYLGADEDIIEPVPMPAEVVRFVDAFLAEHHKPAPFKKRKRDKVRPEEHKFGKQPIFEDKDRRR